MNGRLHYWIKFFQIYKNWGEILLYRIRKRNLTKVILKNGVQFCSSSKSPLPVIVDEVFLLNRYTAFPKVKIKKGDVVIDIGAHAGVFSVFASVSGASQIFSYEPDPDNYKYILKNCANNNISNIFPRNLAVTGSSKQINLYLNESAVRNSVFSESQNLNKGGVIKVKSITLQKIFLNEKIKKIDFLKMDCEGSEGLIIRSTPIKILEKIGKISMEYHNRVSPLNHLAIREKLKIAGFSVKILKFDNYLGYIYAWR